MFRRKINISANRMTATDPVAVDVDLTELRSDAKVPLDLADRGWLESSHDLLRGLRVRETAMDSLSNDLIDVFARAKR